MTRPTRREFLKQLAVGTAATAMAPHLAPAVASAAVKLPEGKRPNIVWISAEDISPNLGCYGDTYATTPNLDKFAAQGVRYDRAFTHAPVCAPARSGIITGMYPTAIGTTWMRCGGVPPPEAKCFPEYLRAVGYFCTNRSKTDYQFSPPPSAWDISGGSGHWRKRPRKDQPFFAVFNFGVTHESSTRRWTPGKQAHDPAKAAVPPYYPDTPVVRQNIACYYDKISQLDGQIQTILDELEADGLADDTIVWFWGDHGWGLTRGKRWIYDSGTRVPLMVRVPAKWRRWAGAGHPKSVASGTVEGEFAQFIDFAPTVLSLAGVPIPKHMQGRAFLGPQKGRAPDHIFAARDRMDETYDCIRYIRDKQYKYIRNFMPYLTRGQHINYMDQTPILQEMRRLHAAGKLNAGPQMQFFEPTKPVHELYDITKDPHEVHNLADEPKHKAAVQRMEKALFAFMKKIGDVALIPEPDFDAMKGGGTTSAPGFTVRKAEGDQLAVEISCLTRGASIIYQADRALQTPAKSGAKASAKNQGLYLDAAKATVHGKGAKKSGDHISNWRGKDTSISWKANITKAGRLPVWIAQSNQGAGGSQYELAVGDAKLKGTIRHTKTWTDFVWVKVGEVDVPKPGPTTVTITPTKQFDGRLGNVAAVVLGGRNPPAGRSGGKGGSGWLVYGGPIELAPGQTLRARACRIGYGTSPTVTYKHGETPTPPAPAADTGPLWREKYLASDLLDRLLAVKAYDGRWTEGTDVYLKALADPDGPVRYWAVVGLHQATKDKPIAKIKAAVEPLLADPSPSVPVAAAHAMVDWGEAEKGLARLIEALKSPSEKGRLFASSALEHLGEKARPALERMEAVLKGQPRYPGAPLKRAVANLRKG